MDAEFEPFPDNPIAALRRAKLWLELLCGEDIADIDADESNIRITVQKDGQEVRQIVTINLGADLKSMEAMIEAADANAEG